MAALSAPDVRFNDPLGAKSAPCGWGTQATPRSGDDESMSPIDTVSRIRAIAPSGTAPLRLLLEHGITRSQVRAAIERGLLHRPHYGVVAITPAHDAESPAQHLERARAVLNRHSGSAVLSHHSAALLHNMPVPFLMPRHVQVTSLLDHHDESDEYFLHRSHHPALPTMMIDGLPVTTRLRTALDIARGLRLAFALVTVEWALRKTAIECAHAMGHDAPDDVLVEIPEAVVTARDELRKEAAFFACRSGVAHLRELVNIASPLSESALESRSRGEFLTLGVPILGQQVRIHDAVGSRRRVDFLLAPWLIGEADGAVKYEGPDGVEALKKEKERDQALRDVGFETLRWSGADMYTHPENVCARIHHALSQETPRIWRSNGR